MQKKYVIMLGLLLIFITGCKMSPFNVEAKVDYVSSEVKGTYPDSRIEIKVALGNSVYIDKVKEIVADVNNQTNVSLKFIDTKITGDSTTIVMYPFIDSTGKAITTMDTNVIKIKAIRLKDENDNDISVNGVIDPITIQSDGTSTTLTAVDGLKAEISGSTVKISWTAKEKATNYKIYREVRPTTDSAFTNTETTLKTVTDTVYYDSDNISADKVYYYRVTALVATNETPKQTIPVSVSYVVSVAQVTNFKAADSVITTDRIKVQWDKPSVIGGTLVGYKLQMSTSIGADASWKDPTAALAINDTSLYYVLDKSDDFGGVTLQSGANRYVRIAGYTVIGGKTIIGIYSDPVKVDIYDSSVPIIQNSSQITLSPYANDTSSTENGVYIEWPVMGANYKYIIERSLDGKTYSQIYKGSGKTAGTKLSYIDSTFLENKVPKRDTRGYYRIRCIDASGKIGLPSGIASITDYEEEAAPVITAIESQLNLDIANSTATELVLKYVDDKGENVVPTHKDDYAGYKIYVATSNDGKYKLLKKVSDLRGATLTSAELTAVGANISGSVWVRVSVYDMFGNETELSMRRQIK